MRYVAHGIAGDDARPKDPGASFTYEDSDDEAMLVTDRGGAIRHGSEKARRLLLLATTSEINPASLKAAVNERAATALRTLCSRLDAVGRGEEPAPPGMSLDTQWGRHPLRADWLDDNLPPRDPLNARRTQRHEPMSLRSA